MSEIRVDVDDRVALLTIDAPERRNAISLGLVTELADALDYLDARPDVGAVVLTGAPPAFCAGAVLDTLVGTDEERLRRIYDGFLRVARSPLPTIAAVNGAAVGAGLNLALSCDVRVAGRSARFIARFAELGILPGGGHTWLLQRAIGRQGALAMNLFGDELSGEEAAAAGLVWRCVDDAVLLDRGVELARFAAAAPPALVQRLVQVVDETGRVATHADAVEVEVPHQLWSLSQPEAVERLAAMQRRISGGR